MSTPVFAAPSCPASQPDGPSAAVAAKACGGQVEVLSARTEASQTFALPSGKFSYQLSGAPQRVRRADGTWVAADPTLVHNTDGSWSPRAAIVDLRVSGGGSGPFVTVARRAASVSLAWPGNLPVPSVTGTTATYADVLPGVDLQVTASVTGFSELLLVKTAAAAANPALTRLTFGLKTLGLRLSSDAATGTLTAKDAGNAVVFSSSTPRLWDSGSAGAVAGARGKTAGEEPPGREAGLATGVSATELTITPPAGFLTDPSTVFPAFIDPTLTVGSGNGMTWTQVYQKFPGTSYWMDSDSEGLKVGYETENGFRNRSFWGMPMPGGLTGATVSSATFSVTERYAFSCTKTPVDLYITGAISSGTTWDAQPSWTTNVGEISTGYGYSSACPGQEVSWNATSAVVSAVTSGWGTLTLGLRSPNESATNPVDWHKYVAGSARLVIVYDHAPTTPPLADLKLGPQGLTACGATASAPARISTTNGLTLNAVLRDPDAPSGDLVKAGWTVTGVAAQYVPAAETAGLTSGSNHQATIPAEAFTDGAPISWLARGVDTDSNKVGGWSATCFLVVDNAAPNPPGIASTDLALRVGPGIVPPAAATAVVHQPAMVTLTPDPADVGRVVGYQWAVAADADPVPSVWAPVKADGSAVVSVAPLPALSFNEIAVTAVKADGSSGATTTARFKANAAVTTPHVPNDGTGDGRADVTTLADVGGGFSAPWRWNATATAGALSSPLAPQGVGRIYPTSTTLSAAGDVDGDGLSDLAMLTQSGSNVVLTVQRSDGNQLLSTPPLQTMAGWSLANIKMVAGDFDGDGRSDVVAFYRTGTNAWDYRVLLSVSTPDNIVFAAPAVWSAAAGYSDWAQIKIVAGDFNGDGRSDVAEFQNFASDQTKLFMHYSTGTALQDGRLQWDSGVNNFAWSRAKFAAGDMTGDGKADITALYSYNASSVSLLTFTAKTDGTMNAWTNWWGQSGGWSWDWPSTDPTTGDFDGDGKADVALLYRCCGAYQARAWTLTTTTAGTGFNAPVSHWSGSIGPVGTGAVPADNPAQKYQLVAVHSNKCLTVPGGSTAEFVQLQQQPCSTTNLYGMFTLHLSGGGQYWIEPAHTTNRCLGVSHGLTTNTTPVVQAACGALWENVQLVYVAGGLLGTVATVMIKPMYDLSCFDVAGVSTADGALIQQYSCLNAGNQEFVLQPVP